MVKGCEKMGASLDRKTDRIEVRVLDPILIVFDLHCFGYWVNSIISMEAVEDVVLGHVGNRVFVEAPVLGVTVPIISEVTQSLEGLLA